MLCGWSLQLSSDSDESPSCVVKSAAAMSCVISDDDDFAGIAAVRRSGRLCSSAKTLVLNQISV